LAGIPYVVIQREDETNINIFYLEIITLPILRWFALYIWSTMMHSLFFLGIASLVVVLLYSLM
jgi:hypothetical protein